VRTGQLVYVSRSGSETVLATNLANGIWHDVALSGRYALSNTAIYVNGVLAGSIAERFAPDQFILGGPRGLRTRRHPGHHGSRHLVRVPRGLDGGRGPGAEERQPAAVEHGDRGHAG
jgi:hypothetical protein